MLTRVNQPHIGAGAGGLQRLRDRFDADAAWLTPNLRNKLRCSGYVIGLMLTHNLPTFAEITNGTLQRLRDRFDADATACLIALAVARYAVAAAT